MIFACLFVSSIVLGSPIVRCKYSVRDVAFVNVHGKSWQLQLLKPDDADAGVFAQWNETLRIKLEHTNVGYVWLEPDSETAKRLPPVTSSPALPALALVGAGESLIPVSSKSDLRFDEQLDLILSSPARREILSQVVDSLCVFVLVESGNKELDAQRRELVDAAIERVTKQMWTLEKPSDNPPTKVTISNADRAGEDWLIQSLGMGESTLPAVAIVYGQGRRLGEVLVADDINLKKLVGRASLCGQDCECDLNRDWLYGAQMIHVWSKRLERDAESSLSFDPQSAFVIAEVAQIIQKNSGRRLEQNSGQSRVDLGGGLIIHDLESVDNSVESEPLESEPPKWESPKSEPSNSEPSNSELSNSEPSDSNGHPDKRPGDPNGAVSLPGDEVPSEASVADAGSGISIPWPLFVGLAAVAMIIVFLRLKI